MRKHYTDGFIVIRRKILDWEWYDDPVVRGVFLHLLVVANWRPTQYKGYDLNPGDVVTGRRALSEDTGFTEDQIRRALKVLEKSKSITIKRTNRFSIITVENYWHYQRKDYVESPATAPAEPQQIPSRPPQNEQYNNNNKKQSVSHSISYVPLRDRLTPGDLSRLTDRFGFADDLITETDCRIRARAKGDEIKNPYKYVLMVARDLKWPSAEDERQQKAARREAEEKLEAAAAAPEMTEEEKQKAAELREKYGIEVKEITEG